MNFLGGKSECRVKDLLRLEPSMRARLLDVLGGPLSHGVILSMSNRLRMLLSTDYIDKEEFDGEEVIDPVALINESPEVNTEKGVNELSEIFLSIYLVKDIGGMDFIAAIESVIYVIHEYNCAPPIRVFSLLKRKLLPTKILAPQFGIVPKPLHQNLGRYYRALDAWYKKNQSRIDQIYGDDLYKFYSLMRLLTDLR